MFHDHTRCELGEGALWHPDRGEFFWFDILNHRMHGDGRVWQFDEPVSAAGWIDRDRVLVASASALWVVHLDEDRRDRLVDLEADRPDTRSNDGKADPWGGFWIGTMGRSGQQGIGAIWRWHRGDLRRLHDEVSTPNAMCFDRARGIAYFSDTPKYTVFRQKLDPDTGWPSAKPEVFLDLTFEGFRPDGATVDAEGRFWTAQWGAGRVACYSPEGAYLGEIRLPAARTSCPSFGGADLDQMFVTTAQQGMSEAEREAEPHAGKTFRVPAVLNGAPVRGLPEPPVIV